MFWRCRLGLVTHESQNLYRQELQPDGSLKTVKCRDSLGKPEQTQHTQKPTPAPPTKTYANLDIWPKYPEYSDEDFFRNLMHAPFASAGPVPAAPPRSTEPATPAEADRIDSTHAISCLPAVAEAFQGVHNRALAAANRKSREPDEATRSNCAKQRPQRRLQRKSPQEGRRPKRPRLAIHSTSAVSPHDADPTHVQLPRPPDWNARREAAVELAASASLPIIHTFTSFSDNKYTVEPRPLDEAKGSSTSSSSACNSSNSKPPTLSARPSSHAPRQVRRDASGYNSSRRLQLAIQRLLTGEKPLGTQQEGASTARHSGL